jgi:nucleoid DNA-binding protein
MQSELKTLDLARLVSYDTDKEVKVKDAEKVINSLAKVMQEQLGDGKTIKVGSLAKLMLVPYKSRKIYNVNSGDKTEIPERGILKVKMLSGAKEAGERFINANGN